VSDTIRFSEKNGVVAWGHFLAQHEGRVSTERFVKAFYDPLDLLGPVLHDLLTERGIETAVGRQLDGVGNIVGLTRSVQNAIYLEFFGFISQPAGRAFGEARLRREGEPWAMSQELGDVDYRRAIIMKIALNNAHGTMEEVVRAVSYIMGDDPPDIRIIEPGNATVHIFIDDIQMMQWDPRAFLLEQMLPRAGGVQLWPYVWDTNHVFGFINQNMGYEGFGVGIMARRLASNRPAIGA